MGESAFTRRRFLQAGGAAAAAMWIGRAASATGLSRLGADTRLSLAWVRPRSANDFAALARFDLTHLARPGGVEVLLWPGDEARLASTGVPFEITVDDVVGRDRAVRASQSPVPGSASQPGERDDYRFLKDYEKDLHDLASARPDLARVFALPEPSEAGRVVYGIEIAEAVRRPDGRPTFYVDGLHHAREWPSGEMAIMFAHDLVSGFGVDAEVTKLLRSLRVVVVPVVNVDGFTYSRTHLYDDRNWTSFPANATGFGAYWRKNRRTLTQDHGLGHMEGHTGYGVDNNRNYALGFGGAGTSPIPADLTYCGPSPFSEPETRNVARMVLSRTVTAALSHHTYSDLVLRPWGDTDDDPPDEPLLTALGDGMAEHNGYTSQPGIDLYPTTGTMSDWSYAAVGALGYTFEHGSSFHPPYPAHVPDYYARNRRPFLMLAAAAADPAHHAVIRGRTMRGHRGSEEAVIVRKRITLPTEASEHTDQLEIAISSQRDGRFEVHLGPSTPPRASLPEEYQVVVGRSVVPVVVGRGERVDLGRIPA